MSFIKSLMPDWLLKFFRPIYHGFVAILANVYFGWPSQKLIVIGITGTAGKSTTAAMLSQILNNSGKKCGYMTTVNFFDGNTNYINKHGLSMPGGWLLQKQLRQILGNGCKYAVVECTSEGLAQNRHLGINFYMGLFINLSQAHLEAHGGFDNYRAAKGKLFSRTKIIGVNLDDLSAEYFLNFPAEKKFGVTFQTTPPNPPLLKGGEEGEVKIFQAEETAEGFNLKNQAFPIKLTGGFNKFNGLLATGAANMLGVDLADAAKALGGFTGIKGRMEPVPNHRGISIFVDYGCEPATIRAALQAANQMPHKRLIHVSGTTGGHRDISKRFIFGKASAELADISIFCNDDVYNSDPQEIVNNMMSGFNSVPKEQKKSGSAEIILDRRSAIHHALEIAQSGDTVLITGKGSEQFLVLPGNKRVNWDEVGVVKEELFKLPNS